MSFFEHSEIMWRDFPELAAGVMVAAGITPDVAVDAQVARYAAIAASRLTDRTESELPEIQAWRRTFSKMGLKPTQYRCASESLLRRFRKEGQLPSLHPLVDLCNAISLAFATPIGVFDIARVDGDLVVRYATGDEDYLTFGGEHEYPEAGEVIFADDAAQVHARRWTSRQSGRSAISDSTTTALIVAEAMHADAAADLRELMTALSSGVGTTWAVKGLTVLDSSARRFEFSVG